MSIKLKSHFLEAEGHECVRPGPQGDPGQAGRGAGLRVPWLHPLVHGALRRREDDHLLRLLVILLLIIFEDAALQALE